MEAADLALWATSCSTVLYFVLVLCSPVPREAKRRVRWESRAPTCTSEGEAAWGNAALTLKPPSLSPSVRKELGAESWPSIRVLATVPTLSLLLRHGSAETASCLPSHTLSGKCSSASNHFIHLLKATLPYQEQSRSSPVPASSIAVQAVIHSRESIHTIDMLDLGRQMLKADVRRIQPSTGACALSNPKEQQSKDLLPRVRSWLLRESSKTAKHIGFCAGYCNELLHAVNKGLQHRNQNTEEVPALLVRCLVGMLEFLIPSSLRDLHRASP